MKEWEGCPLDEDVSEEPDTIEEFNLKILISLFPLRKQLSRELEGLHHCFGTVETPSLMN